MITVINILKINDSTCRYNGPNLVLKYDNAKKRLVNIAVDNRSSPYYALRDRQGNAIGVTACDIDGDGREEIYVLNSNNAFSGMYIQILSCRDTNTQDMSIYTTQYSAILDQVEQRTLISCSSFGMDDLRIF